MAWQRSGLQRLFMSLVGKITWFSFPCLFYECRTEIIGNHYGYLRNLWCSDRIDLCTITKGKLAPAAETNTSNASFDEDDYDDGF